VRFFRRTSIDNDGDLDIVVNTVQRLPASAVADFHDENNGIKIKANRMLSRKPQSGGIGARIGA